jgi:hypothetical protein
VSVLTYTGELTVAICWCGMRHAVPVELRELQRRQQGDGREVQPVYCPLGHEYIPSGKSKVAKLEEELERERQRAQAERDLREDTERRLSAQRAATTRAKRRQAAAVCPCCNRSFVQLRRHMAAKHPEHLAEHSIAPEGTDR